MCYHISLSQKLSAIRKKYGRKTDEIEEDTFGKLYHVSAFSLPFYPIVTEDPEIRLFQWGLIPYWTRTTAEAEKIRKRTFNARAESIFEKPSFRSAIKTQRCIVPVTGFFDWRHENGKKTAYYIRLKDRNIFSMAGIYDEWTSPDTGRTLTTFSIITTGANPLMSYIHNTNFRMPVILLKENEEKWLYPILKKGDIERLLSPYEESHLEAYPIQNNFLKKSPHDPSIIHPSKTEEDPFPDTEEK